MKQLEVGLANITDGRIRWTNEQSDCIKQPNEDAGQTLLYSKTFLDR